MARGIPRDRSLNRRILHRLKITRGHLNKVIGMVEKDEYCIDVVHQSLAVQAALKEINKLILKNHIETCMAHATQKGNGKEVISEIVNVIEKT